MKKIKLLLICAVLALGTCTFMACTADDDNINDPTTVNQTSTGKQISTTAYNNKETSTGVLDSIGNDVSSAFDNLTKEDSTSK